MEFHVDRLIRAAPAEVARVMFDPDLEDRWVEKSGKAEKLTPGPLAPGSRVRHDAGLLGLRAPFVTEVTEIDPEQRLAMEIVEGPVRGFVIYHVAATAGGAIASVHIRNEAKAPIPSLPWARKHHIEENLKRLAAYLTHPH